MQLYESNTAAVKSEIATFLEAFPNGVVWGNTNNGQGYDLVLMGQVEPIKIDVDEMEAKLQSPEYAPVAQSLREIGIQLGGRSVRDLRRHADRISAPWLHDAQINRDRNLRLQYLAGLGLNLYQSGPIYADMLCARAKFPDSLFTGIAGDAAGRLRQKRSIDGARNWPLNRSCEPSTPDTTPLSPLLASLLVALALAVLGPRAPIVAASRRPTRCRRG